MFFHLLWSFHVLEFLPVCREMKIWIENYSSNGWSLRTESLECPECLTITDWAALVLRLSGSGAGQDRTDDRIADDSPLLQGRSSDLHWTPKRLTGRSESCRLQGLYLAAAGETPVVVGGPAGAVSVMLVLEETGLRVFLQLLRVFGGEIVPLLLLLPPGPELTGVWHVDLEEHEGLEVKREVREPPTAPEPDSTW